MDFYKALDTDSSKKIIDLVSDAVGNNPDNFKQVFDILLLEIPQISSRAGRVVTLSCEKYPELIKPYLHDLIKKLPKMKNQAVLRSVLKIFMLNMKLIKSEKEESILLDNCLRYLAEKEYEIAVKAYSMDILYKLSKRYPELCYEIAAVIKNQLPYSSAGIKSRAKQLFNVV